jgi:hypothetical protein
MSMRSPDRRHSRIPIVIASQRVRAKRGPMTGSAKQSSPFFAALDCFVGFASSQ